jgi:hypothetical protein
MELFGYVCSAYCQGQAEKRKLDLPVYEFKKDVVESKAWRKIGRISLAVAAAVIALLGFWAWYAWVGSVPHAVFTVAVPAIAHDGQCRFVEPHQTVILKGGRLARYDWKAKKEIWSVALINPKEIEADAVRQFDAMLAAYQKMKDTASDELGLGFGRPPDLADVTRRMQDAAASEFRLHGSGHDVWLASAEKLVKYDWETGKPGAEVTLKNRAVRIFHDGGSMVAFTTSDSGQRLVTRVNPATGEVKSEEVAPSSAPALSAAGLPAKPASGASTSLDPAHAATRLSGFGPFAAAQAVALQSQVRQEKILAMIKEDERGRVAPSGGFEAASSRLIAAGPNLVEFSVRLIEQKSERRQAMKAPPKRSALDGPINQAATAAIANEILNDMQRDRTEGVEVVDVSRYQVVLKRLPPGDAPEWTGEVLGTAEFFPLKTVDLLVAGTTLLVFDKSNKKLWESKLTYPIAGGFGFTDDAGEEAETPSAPGVERDDALYFFDKGVLTAFDLPTGNVRWRMPSVGISRLSFDGRGAIYVSTTSASPDRLKYSQQIDVSQKTASLIQKVEAKSGRTLWKVEGRGRVAYISGNLIYSVVSSPGVDGLAGMGAVAPHIRLFRLAAGSGRTLWEHHETRFPLDVAFQRNTIALLFHKELEVLRFYSP